MDTARIEKIKRFLADQSMQLAVKDTIQASFLKKNPTADVQFLAASRIALDLLEDAWKELHRTASIPTTEVEERRNPAV